MSKETVRIVALALAGLMLLGVLAAAILGSDPDPTDQPDTQPDTQTASVNALPALTTLAETTLAGSAS